MNISFTDEDREFARKMVYIREHRKRGELVKSQKVAPDRSDEAIDYIGVLAEMAISKALNVPPPEMTNLLGGDGGWDFMVNSNKIEVKYTFYPHGRLLLHNKSKLKADYYVLLTGNDREMKIVGWTDNDTFSKKGYFDPKIGHGENFVLDQKQLRPFSELMKRLL
jgi:hypothetical protein